MTLPKGFGNNGKDNNNRTRNWRIIKPLITIPLAAIVLWHAWNNIQRIEQEKREAEYQMTAAAERILLECDGNSGYICDEAMMVVWNSCQDNDMKFTYCKDYRLTSYLLQEGLLGTTYTNR